MHGESDLSRLLADLGVQRREGVYTFVTGEWPALNTEAHATVIEAEGHSYVVTVDDAQRAGAPIEFEAAWLTLTVHSALTTVGLTALVTGVLAEAGIACNVVAGFHHDHLLVPVERAEEAIGLVQGLGSRPDAQRR